MFHKNKEWKDFEYFDANWEKRVRLMASFISPGKSIMDLGCGKMYLKKYLNGNIYIPVDYKARDEQTIVADFNKKEFPSISSDISFISGCLEYISDYSWFLRQVCSHSREVIISYCTTDAFPDLKQRKQNNWVNNLSHAEIVQTFADEGFESVNVVSYANGDEIFIFKKNE